jgi:hypothetical protein
MSDTNRKYTLDQLAIVDAFAAYGVEQSDIIFYSDKAEPFFTYEATAALCNQLTDIKTIDVEPVTGFAKTTAIRCRLGFDNGNSRSGVGVVNHNETIDEQVMNEHQRVALASARAIRNALKASGINLLKAHLQIQQTGELAVPTVDMLRSKHLGESHHLGKEIGFITVNERTNQTDKTAWYNIIFKRYGRNSSGELTNDELSDFVAFLRSCVRRAA